MAGKKADFPLSITLRTVDKATSGIKRVNEQLERTFGPLSKLKKEFGTLGQNAGIGKIAAGVRGIGAEVKSVAKGLGVIAGAGVAVGFAFKRVADEFDDLGDAADAIGVSVDALAQLRYAAGQSGGEVQALDMSLEQFNKSLGQMSAGTGRLSSFLDKVNPAFKRQLKAAKSGEEAFDVLADAMARLEDPAKKAALATAAGFDPSMIPLLSQGSKGVRSLREEFARNAGSQQDAAEAAGKIDVAWRRLGSSMQGVKASIVSGLGPVFADLTKKATAFLTAHKGEIAAWARDFGEKLPARIAKLIEVLRTLKDDAIMPVVRGVGWLVDKLGGAESAVKILAAAWLGFKALKIVGHLASIAQGFVGVAVAAKAAGVAMAGGGGGRLGKAGRAAAGIGKAGAAGIGAGVAAVGGKALVAGKALLASPVAAGVAALGAGAGAGFGLDWLTGKLSGEGRGISDRLSGTGGTQLFGRSLIRQATGAGAFDRPTLGAANIGAAAPPAQAAVTVKFEGAPRGMRVTTEPGATADVTTDVGYQMGPAL